MAEHGSIRIMPITGKLLTTSWRNITREHIYQADALQLASCKEEECDIVVSADRRLLHVAMRQKIHGFDPERDEKKLMSL